MAAFSAAVLRRPRAQASVAAGQQRLAREAILPQSQ
jgi:hypothetical protein